MSVNVGDVAISVGKGLFAGVVGTAAMTISSTLEMKIRGHPGSSAPSEAVERSDARYRLTEALAALPERERTVLYVRTGFDGRPQSLTTIGKSLGDSRERARQLEGKALKELRERQGELRLEGLVA